jgi:hypothetical protein
VNEVSSQTEVKLCVLELYLDNSDILLGSVAKERKLKQENQSDLNSRSEAQYSSYGMH